MAAFVFCSTALSVQKRHRLASCGQTRQLESFAIYEPVIGSGCDMSMVIKGADQHQRLAQHDMCSVTV